MSSILKEGRGVAAAPRTASLVSIAVLLASCAPLFVLTMHSWASAVLFSAALLGLFVLARGVLPAAPGSAADEGWARALVITYAAPVAATLLAGGLRGELDASLLDSPARFLAAIPVFLLVRRSGQSVGRVMQWVLPIALACAALDLALFGHDPRWRTGDIERITTRVVDPLVFGYTTLSFALLCLVSIRPGDWRAGRRWAVVLRLGGTVLGLSLSVLSASRSGWLAFPIVFGVWCHELWGRRHRFGMRLAVGAAVLLPIVAYLAIPLVTERVDAALDDLAAYSWTQPPKQESSIGYRISYVRMAADLLAMRPFSGFGDTSHNPPLDASAFPYASRELVSGAFASGFHNQVVSNGVRSGVGGLLATAALMLVPLLLCAYGLRRGPPEARMDAIMGLSYCTCLAVSSLSTEVVDLKFAASFYAVMTAAFCGAVLGRRGGERQAP